MMMVLKWGCKCKQKQISNTLRRQTYNKHLVLNYTLTSAYNYHQNLFEDSVYFLRTNNMLEKYQDMLFKLPILKNTYTYISKINFFQGYASLISFIITIISSVHGKGFFLSVTIANITVFVKFTI